MKSLKKSCSKKFTRRGTNQEAKELFSLIDLTGKLLREKFNDDDDDAEASYGSSERKYSVQLRLHQIREKTRTQITKTIESVEADILKSNIHNVILAMANLLGGEIKIIPIYFYKLCNDNDDCKRRNYIEFESG